MQANFLKFLKLVCIQQIKQKQNKACRGAREQNRFIKSNFKNQSIKMNRLLCKWIFLSKWYKIFFKVSLYKSYIKFLIWSCFWIQNNKVKFLRKFSITLPTIFGQSFFSTKALFWWSFVPWFRIQAFNCSIRSFRVKGLWFKGFLKDYRRKRHLAKKKFSKNSLTV